jgi:hypothetical protein
MNKIPENFAIIIKNKVHVYEVDFEKSGNTGLTLFPDREVDKILSKRIMTDKYYYEIKNGFNPEQIGFLNAEIKRWKSATGIKKL